MPVAGKKPRPKRTSLLNDSRGRAGARAPLGTPGLNNTFSTIRVLARHAQSAQPVDREPVTHQEQAKGPGFPDHPNQEDRRAQTPPSYHPPNPLDTSASDKNDQMSQFGDLAQGSSFSFASDMRLPLSRRGKQLSFMSTSELAGQATLRPLQENEEPRSHNPVSLEDFIVHKQSGRNRANRDSTLKAPATTSSQLSSTPTGTSADEALVKPQEPNVSASTMGMRSTTMRPNLTIRTASMTSAPTMRSGGTLMASLGAEFREQQHSNGDLSVHQWSEEEQKFVPVGRVGQGDVSYFVRFCERSIQDNQHDAQKMSLYREHIQVMIKKLSEKRKQALGSYSQPNSAALSRAGTSSSSLSPDARRYGPPTISGFGALNEDADQYQGDYASRRAYPTLGSNAGLPVHTDGSMSQPQTAFYGGAFPRYAGQQTPMQYYPSALEDRQQMYYEREQQYRAMQQHLLAQQDTGKKLTGYEPPTTVMAAHRPALDLPSFDPAQSSIPFANLSGNVQEFVPKTRPLAVAPPPDEDSMKLSDLVASSTDLRQPDERLVARKEQERHRLEKGLNEGFEAPTEIDEYEEYCDELDAWFSSGRVDHEKTMKFSQDLLSAEGKLDDQDAQVAMPLMVALFKAFQSYDQSSRFQARAQMLGPERVNEQLDAYAKFTTPPKKAILPTKPGEQPSLFSAREVSPSPSSRRRGRPALPDLSLFSPQKGRTARRDSTLSSAHRSGRDRSASRHSEAGKIAVDRFGLPL